MKSIYLDYNATTELDEGVYQTMIPYLTNCFGNPSSIHHIGRKAKSALDICRYRVSEIFRCKPSEIIFTSGGTESNNLAILGTARGRSSKGKHIITSAIEHHAVLRCFESLQYEGFEISVLPVSYEGYVDPSDLQMAIRSSTILVSVMFANNEVGTIQPIKELSSICRKHGIIFHTDAVQAFGKVPFANIDQFDADLVSLCAHKFHGPKGAGILYCRSPFFPKPIFHGGSHENERRPGTENLAAIVGMVAALERFVTQPVFDFRSLSRLTLKLIDGMSALPSVEFHGTRERRIVNTAAFSVKGWEGISLLAALDLEGICASSGSACSVGSIEVSHVLKAMGSSHDRAKGLVRFSTGRGTSEDEIDYTLDAFSHILKV